MIAETYTAFLYGEIERRLRKDEIEEAAAFAFELRSIYRSTGAARNLKAESVYPTGAKYFLNLFGATLGNRERERGIS